MRSVSVGLRVCLLSLAAVYVSRCQAEINVTDYIFWKKDYINQWNLFFPSRALEEERLTNRAAVLAMNSLDSGLSNDLSKIVAFQYRELQTAQQMMAGTDAEGCISGISHFLDQAIEEQLKTYEDCSADAQSKMSRLYNTWTRVNASYNTVYQRTLSGIDVCARTYPNKDSIDRLRSCVESMNNNYFTVANTVKSLVSPSPSMSYFQRTVVECASDAAQAVLAKGSKFLKMLVSCAALSGTVDPSLYADELSQWKANNNTLADQIKDSQKENFLQVSNIEVVMQNYYNLKKQGLEQYVIESRGLDFYLNKIYSYLNDYYNTVTATSLDNPGDSGCAATAKNALDVLANSAAAKSLSCDQLIVNDTKGRVSDIFDKFWAINTRMASIGNVALQSCLSQGYVFAPNTVKDCFKLTSSEFQVEYSDRFSSISNDIEIISNYVATFFSSSDLPCGVTTLKKLLLEAEKVLYVLKRCLYQGSGTTYSVTTPVPEITST